MSTAIDICNSALTKLGQEPIASFTEDSKAGRALNTQYPIIRDMLLQDHYWNFAIKTVSLAQLPTTDTRGVKFALPSDYHQAIKLLSNRFYKIESGELITDQSTATLKYVWKNENVASYTPLFKEALAYALANDIAYLMTQSQGTSDRMEAKAIKAKLNAAAVDAQEDFMDSVHGDDFIEGRFGEVQSHFK